MTHDEITAAIPGVKVRVGDTNDFLWLTYEMDHHGQQHSWSRRCPIDPSAETIGIFAADLNLWKLGVAES